MDDFSEFKKAIGDVTPLKIDERVSLNKTQQDRIAVAQRRQAAVTDAQDDPNHLSDTHVHMVKPYDIIQYKKDGVQEGVYRKFRLGKYAMDARLDLHRRTVQQAREEVYRFIADAMKYDLRTLIILHGKGEKEATPALLKSWTNKWLREFDDVIAFHSAQPQHGGTGALYVMLRKSERKKQETREKHRIK